MFDMLQNIFIDIPNYFRRPLRLVDQLPALFSERRETLPERAIPRRIVIKSRDDQRVARRSLRGLIPNRAR
ncbi:hypothetical protein BCPG_04898 [Burkholderia cenocepacia PC184]|nr:hypothetical protein BCPG_04898 [Burkholderia cenocepacia PC184]